MMYHYLYTFVSGSGGTVWFRAVSTSVIQLCDNYWNSDDV